MYRLVSSLNILQSINECSVDDRYYVQVDDYNQCKVTRYKRATKNITYILK